MRDQIVKQLKILKQLILQDEYDVDIAVDMIEDIEKLVGECYEN